MPAATRTSRQIDPAAPAPALGLRIRLSLRALLQWRSAEEVGPSVSELPFADQRC